MPFGGHRVCLKAENWLDLSSACYWKGLRLEFNGGLTCFERHCITQRMLIPCLSYATPVNTPTASFPKCLFVSSLGRDMSIYLGLISTHVKVLVGKSPPDYKSLP